MHFLFQELPPQNNLQLVIIFSNFTAYDVFLLLSSSTIVIYSFFKLKHPTSVIQPRDIGCLTGKQVSITGNSTKKSNKLSRLKRVTDHNFTHREIQNLLN